MNVPFLEEVDRGLYVWATLDQQSILKLQMFPLAFPSPIIKYDNATKLHSTVLHCKSLDQMQGIPVLPELSTHAMPGVPTIWEDHKQRHIIVLVLDCPELVAANQEFQSHGLPHSYPDYTPHITLGEFTRRLSEAEIGQVSSVFRSSWRSKVSFEPTLKYSLCC